MLYDKDLNLKANVASMKANLNAKAQFREVIGIAEDREFWRKSEAS